MSTSLTAWSAKPRCSPRPTGGRPSRRWTSFRRSMRVTRSRSIPSPPGRFRRISTSWSSTVASIESIPGRPPTRLDTWRRRPDASAPADLSQGGAVETLDDDQLARELVPGQRLSCVIAEGVERRWLRAASRDDAHDDPLAPLPVRAPRRQDSSDARMAGECGLDLRRPDLLAPTQDHVGDPAENAHQPIVVYLATVAGTQPAARFERGEGRGWIETVATHEGRPAHEQLAPARRAHLHAG